MRLELLFTVLVLMSRILCDDQLTGQCSSDTCDMAFRVILAGATGETGRLVLDNLLKDDRISKVTTLGRRESKIQNDKLDHKIVDFDNLPEEAFNDHDVAICTLGTTRAKSGKDGFIKVDKTYVMSFAEKSKAAGVKQFHMMSSQGANANSYFLYTQVKGEVDDKILGMGFERSVVYRPAVLLVKRQEGRMAEKAAQWVLGWADYSRGMSIPIKDVADSIVGSIFDDAAGIIDNRSIIAKAAALKVPVEEEAAAEEVPAEKADAS
ncbi:oxidoreductase HTATIP2-like [Bolinopsis microptera]|uniref:oxidoreductase HTATIP2-like n=1 Tax=Bolinopsis microptera TaxID=2820187 RepID=UPI00307A01EC